MEDTLYPYFPLSNTTGFTDELLDYHDTYNVPLYRNDGVFSAECCDYHVNKIEIYSQETGEAIAQTWVPSEECHFSIFMALAIGISGNYNPEPSAKTSNN